MQLSDAQSVIKELGGIIAIAALTGRQYDAAWVWKKTGKFPSNTFLVIQAALHDRGYSAPASLWGMAEAEQAAE